MIGDFTAAKQGKIFSVEILLPVLMILELNYYKHHLLHKDVIFLVAGNDELIFMSPNVDHKQQSKFLNIF